MMRNFPKYFLLPGVLSFAGTVQAADIEPPKAQVVDRFGVNVANGQVTHSLDTVSIGGAMGLAHSISVRANEFNYTGYRGFNGKFYAQARDVELSSANGAVPKNIMRVYDSTGSADFGYYVGSALQVNGHSLTSGYNYRPMGDERHTLDWDSAYLYWTKPDGTVVRFSRTLSPQSASSSATLTDITYPNGFTIAVTLGGMSVNTNTGFQLKQLYPPDNRPLDPDKAILNGQYPSLAAPPANSAGWAQSNPKYIKAINNAFEYCAPTTPDCTLTRPWPTATFNWPAGMPRTMYLGNSIASVIDSAGRTTTYAFRAYDLAYVSNQGGVVAEGYTLGRQMSPRLVGVSPPASAQQLTYDYKNVFVQGGSSSSGTWDYRLQSSGVTTNATKLGLASSYGTTNFMGDSIRTASSVFGDYRVHLRANLPGIVGPLYFAETPQGKFWHEPSARNFVTRFDDITGGPSQSFTYARSNLTKIVYQEGQPNVTNVEAAYPASCTASTRKTCNQAIWIKDARGHVTHYTYHAPSGQVESIAPPPNARGISAQTRYEYQQLSARYYNGGSSKITGPPIWMKTAEKSCINSNTAGGACQGGDEVVTRYEYNHDNLLLTGTTVTSPDGTTLRTCYQYDIYGNQIGETAPNAPLTSCAP